MTMPDSPHPALADHAGSSASSFPSSRVQLPLALRARDGRLLGESLTPHAPSTTGAVEPERTVVDRAQLSLFTSASASAAASSFASSVATRRSR